MRIQFKDEATGSSHDYYHEGGLADFWRQTAKNRAPKPLSRVLCLGTGVYRDDAASAACIDVDRLSKRVSDLLCERDPHERRRNARTGLPRGNHTSPPKLHRDPQSHTSGCQPDRRRHSRRHLWHAVDFHSRASVSKVRPKTSSTTPRFVPKWKALYAPLWNSGCTTTSLGAK